MSSRSATVLVIFIVAIVAFCLASVFGAMTGPINLFNGTESGGILDNLSVITDNDDIGRDTVSSQYSQDYSTNDQSSSSSDNQQTQDNDKPIEEYSEKTTDDKKDHSDSKHEGNESS